VTRGYDVPLGAALLVGEGALAKSDFSVVFNICKSKLERKTNEGMQMSAQVGFLLPLFLKKASGKPFCKFILAKCKQTTTLISVVAYS